MFSALLLCSVWNQSVPGQPYTRHQVQDELGRTVTYYLSEVEPGADLPVVLYVQGSGNSSHFGQREGRIVPQNGHIVFPEVFAGKAQVLIVEKPGVKYLDGGTGNLAEAPKEFLEEHTLDRWVTALRAAAKASGGVSLVVGHSEGGLVACRFARLEQTPCVATLAGGGASFLFDLMSLARKGHFFQRISEDPQKRAEYIAEQWRKIEANPDSTTDFFFGHPYRRWSSFLSSSPMEELTQYSGAVFIGHGAKDDAMDVASSDALYAELLAKGREVTYARVEDANHSFAPADRSRDGWTEITAQIRDWWLQRTSSTSAGS